MVINKSYMEIMRAGKSRINYPYYNVRKQNDAGMTLALFLLIAGAVILVGVIK